MQQRKCGDCTACCTLLGVSSLNKPKNTKCEHQCKKGCAIYDKRPEGCRAFECLWLRGAFGPLDRPDKLGIVFSTTNPDVPIDTPVGQFPQGLVAMEMFEGAAKTKKGQKILARTRHVPVIVVPPNDGPRQLLVPAIPGKTAAEVEAEAAAKEASKVPAAVEPSSVSLPAPATSLKA